MTVKNDPENLTDRQKTILDLLRKNSKKSRNKLSEELNISEATIKRELSYLSSIGLITRIGPDKGGHWEVIEK